MFGPKLSFNTDRVRDYREGQDDSSSASSLGIETPVNPDHAFTTDPSIVSDDNRNATINPNNTTFFSHKSDEHDRSHDPLPAISSMEVELSMTSTIEEKNNRRYSSANSPYHNPDTPHRASEVFAFLNKPQRNRESITRPASAPPSTDGSYDDEDDEDAYGGFERPLPMLPTDMDPDSSSDSATHQVLSPVRSITTGSTMKPIVDENFLSPQLGSTSLRPSPSSSQKTISTADKITSSLQKTETSPTSNDSPSSAGSIFEDPPQLATIMNRTPTPVGNGPLREGPRAHQVQVTPSASGPARAPSRNSITGLTHTLSNAIGGRIPRGPKGPRTSVALTHDLNNPFDDASTPHAAVKNTTTISTTAKAKAFSTTSTTPMPTPKPSHIPTVTSSAAHTPMTALRTTTNTNTTIAPSSIPLRSGTRIPSIASSIGSKAELNAALSATASAYPTPSSVVAGWKEKRRISSSGSWSVVSEEETPRLVGRATRGVDVQVPGKGRGGHVVGAGKENGQVTGPRAMPTRSGSRSLDLVRGSSTTNADNPNTATTTKNAPHKNFDLNTPANANNAGAMNLKSRLPVTPARSRAIFDAEMTPGDAPSPASSSELSPVAQQMMADLRETKRRGFVRFGEISEMGSSPGGGGEKKRNRFVNVITNGRG